MNRSSLALLIFLAASAPAYSQSVARVSQSSKSESLVAESTNETQDNRVLAARAITALKRLDRDVLVYRSLGDFEADGRLARVSCEAFAKELQAVTKEVEPMLSRLPQGRLKLEISNALASYRDGAFWWQKIYQPRVMHVSALSSSEINSTPSDAAFLATVPYTVAIHWRQAAGYLKHAEERVNGSGK